MSRWKVPQHFRVRIGGNTFIDCPTVLEYKGQSLFDLKRSDSDGFLGINFDLFNEEGTRLATIRNGNFVGEVPSGYKITSSHDHYSLIEEATGRVVCDIKLREQADGGAELDVSAQMYTPDGALLELTPSETNIESMKTRGCEIRNCPVAISIG